MTRPAKPRRIPVSPARALIVVIDLYRNMVSPLRPPSCRFIPTCSEYAVDALRQHGLVRGGWLSVARLARCGPWHRGGWDPVPEQPTGPRNVKARRTRGVSGKRGESEHIVL